MTEIPCIEDSCLKYPICRHKKDIECNALERHFLNMLMKLTKKVFDDNNTHYIYDHCYDEIQKTLPKLFKIAGEDGILVDTRQLNEMYKECGRIK